ncbi:MAG: crotonase/enoyl-CoA hydratase family protein [Pseudomonadota bacterium]
MQVSSELTEDVLVLKLDDGKKNAITADAVGAISEALDKAEADASAVVLAGRPGSFCAGFDINVLKSGDSDAFARLGAAGAGVLLKLWQFPRPLVAACTGHAFTIGALWLLSADYRIGERGSFKIGMNETALGQPLPDWALEPLRSQINPQHLEPVAVHSQLHDPEAALAAGFLHELVDGDEALARAMVIAAEFAKLPTKAFGQNKLGVRKHSTAIMARSIEAQRQALAGAA